MNALELRKRLLVTESELNRAQLVADMTTMKAGVRTIKARAKSFGAVALLVSALMSLKRRPRVEASAKRSWVQTILKNAGLVSTIWSVFRPPARKQEDR